MWQAIIVGGGFYGASIAHYLATKRGLSRVLLLEREDALLTRSSFVNQARVHGGYHYPRSFTTAYRSRVNMPRFRAEFGPAVFDGFEAIYAIASRNSKVTCQQMERFCREIGASLEPAPEAYARLFNPRFIARSYLTVEQAFNADILRRIMLDRLAADGVETRTGAEVEEIRVSADRAEVRGRRGGEPFALEAQMVFNCTYARLQQVVRGTHAPNFRLRHEITEMVLVEPPEELKALGVTVMDGAFFSIMPFPARGLHSLSHVRYTPHQNWVDSPDVDPYERLAHYPRGSAADWMIRDSARYLPCVARAKPVKTLFEVKTVLLRSEGDDSRPILFERHGEGGRLFSVLGGKIDNIFDILERLDAESLVVAESVL